MESGAKSAKNAEFGRWPVQGIYFVESMRKSLECNNDKRE